MFILERKNSMKMLAVSGSALAAAAATLLLAGAVSAPSFAAEEAKGHCVGANACKGTSACKTASNACKGQNSCKGQGFTEATKADCAKVEGAKFESAK
jgi:uncharacterized membrane protein